MMGWRAKIKLKDLLKDDLSLEGIRKAMGAVAERIENNRYFEGFSAEDLHLLKNIPEGDSVFGPLDYAKAAMDAVYDYADAHRIWVE